MTQKGITNQEQVSVLSRKLAFMKDKVTFVIVGFVKILIWIYFEDVVTHLETYRFHFFGHIIAVFRDLTESLIGGTVKIVK